jgi:hypothetical protein
MEHVRPLSAFYSVSVADFCFSKTVFSAMFVQDVENAADRRRLIPTCPTPVSSPLAPKPGR